MENNDNVKYATCIRCGAKMDFIGEDDLDGVLQIEHKCPECKAFHTTYLPDEEERKNYEYWNNDAEDTLGGCSHGYEGECPNCGSHIIWQSDFMRSEVWGDVDEDELDEYGCPKDDALVTYVLCPHCGANIEIVDAKPSELEK